MTKSSNNQQAYCKMLLEEMGGNHEMPTLLSDDKRCRPQGQFHAASSAAVSASSLLPLALQLPLDLDVDLDLPLDTELVHRLELSQQAAASMTSCAAASQRRPSQKTNGNANASANANGSQRKPRTRAKSKQTKATPNSTQDKEPEETSMPAQVRDYNHERRIRDRVRARQKKQQVEAMRAEVERLQRQFDALCLRAKAQADQATSIWGSPKHRPLQPSPQGHTKEGISPETILELAMEAQQLRRENEEYKCLIRDHELISNAVQTVIQFDGIPTAAPPPLAAADEGVARAIGPPRHARGDYGSMMFTPYSAEECYRMMTESFEIGKAQWATHAASSQMRQLSAEHNCTGWQGARFRQDTNLSFCQTARILKFNPRDMLNTSWRLYLDVEKYGRSFAKTHHLQVLQIFNDNVAIFRRVTENRHTGAINHSVFLCYRVRVGDEYLVGYRSLPLWGNTRSNVAGDEMGCSLLDRSAHETNVTMHYWSTSRLPQASDPKQSCVLRRWGTLELETVDDAVFWEQEVMEMAMRFQHLLVKPLVSSLRAPPMAND